MGGWEHAPRQESILKLLEERGPTGIVLVMIVVAGVIYLVLEAMKA